MKKIGRLVSLIAAISILITGPTVSVYAQEQEISTEEERVLFEAYQEVMEYAQMHTIPLGLSYETFVEEYQAGQYSGLDEYKSVYFGLLEPQSRTRGAKGDGWYYNTGTSLPRQANYSNYNLLNSVQKGDIIFEANGGFGITAHVAIVEGIFYDSVQNQNYIRVVEAADQGVIRSVLDDQRVDDRGVSIYRVSGLSAVHKSIAVDFCISQLGKGYFLDFAKDTSGNEADWYCSELVWAAYYNQGFNIETANFFNEPGVTPRDIINSALVFEVPY